MQHVAQVSGEDGVHAVSADGADGVDPRGRRRPHATTIYDVAERAGVNPSTVSRALNGRGRVGEETQRRIRAAAADLNFRHNPAARGLPTGRYRTISVVVADITNPVFTHAVRGAEQAAAVAGYTLLVVESQESGALEGAAIERVLPIVDALIMVGSRLRDDEIVEAAARRPVVVVNRRVAGVDDVCADQGSGIAELLVHLSSQGHRSLAYLSGPTTSWVSRNRWQELFAQAVARGMAIVEIGPNRPSLEGGTEVADRVLASGATAAIAYNAMMAIGLLQELQRRDVPVPAALSVSGFDDVFGTGFTTPPLTTVRTSMHRLGIRAAERALELIEPTGRTGREPEEEPVVGTELVVRGSTGPVLG